MIVSLSACREEERAAPDAVYKSYYAKVIEGRTFEEDVSYHSKSRVAEIMAQLESGASGSEEATNQIKDLYLDFSQNLAKCGDLTLREERVDEDAAQLIYDVEDTCSTGGNGELHIQMVYEDGWKIASDELKITAN